MILSYFRPSIEWRVAQFRICMVACFVIGTISGCGTAPRKLNAVERFRGKVIKEDNTPLGNLRIVLQPTGDGYEIEMDVNEQGEFQGEGIPGKYIYYFAPAKNSKPATLKIVQPDYFEPKSEHSVQVRSTEEVICKVGKP